MRPVLALGLVSALGAAAAWWLLPLASTAKVSVPPGFLDPKIGFPGGSEGWGLVLAATVTGLLILVCTGLYFWLTEGRIRLVPKPKRE